jgi:hypothetical protein
MDMILSILHELHSFKQQGDFPVRRWRKREREEEWYSGVDS